MGSLSTTFNKSRQKKFFLFKYFYQIVNMRNVFLFLLILLAIFSTIEAGSKACKITKLKVAIFGCKSLCDYCHKYYGGKAKCLKVCKQKPCPSTTTANTTKISPITNTTSKNPTTTKKTTVITKNITVKANITTTNTKKSSANTNKSSANTKKSTATTLNKITRTTKSAANSTKILLTKKISATTKKPKSTTENPKKSINVKAKVTI